MKPHDCVVLGIDPGASSGWAIVDRGVLTFSGVAVSTSQRCDVMDAVDGAVQTGRLVVVAEGWTVGAGCGKKGRGDRWNPKTILGLGAAWGRWLEQFEMAGLGARQIVRPTPATWRRAMLTGLAYRTRAEAKKAAARVAKKYLGREPDADEAEAVCIALYGARAPETLDALPKRWFGPKKPRFVIVRNGGEDSDA